MKFIQAVFALCLTFVSIYLHQIVLHMPHKIRTALKQRLHLSSTDQQPVARGQHAVRASVVLQAESSI